MKYRLILFDLGMTLVQTSIAELYRQVLADFGEARDIPDIEKAFYLTDKEFMRRYPHVLGTRPTHFLPWYLGIVNHHLGVRLDLVEVYRVFTAAQENPACRWHLIPGAKETLEQLKCQGLRLGLVSNWDHTCRQVLASNQLDAYFDVTVVSSEIGAEKPDAAIFQTALDTAGVTAAQVLYVGDNYYDDVIGAEKLGIKCLLLAPYGRLGLEELDYNLIIRGLEEVPSYLE